MQGKYCVCPHLVDEAVVDDGAADLLVELEERLHLVHRDLKPNPHQKSQIVRHCHITPNGSRQAKYGGRDRIFTASGLVGELRELAEVEGGPPAGAAAALELEEGQVEVVAAPVVLLGVDERGGGGGRRPCAAGGGGGAGAEVGQAAGEDEEEGFGDGDEREEDGAEALPQRQRALRLPPPPNPIKK
jgi:hypothetical protein